jgi:hypothetical protein
MFLFPAFMSSLYHFSTFFDNLLLSAAISPFDVLFYPIFNRGKWSVIKTFLFLLGSLLFIDKGIQKLIVFLVDRADFHLKLLWITHYLLSWAFK